MNKHLLLLIIFSFILLGSLSFWIFIISTRSPQAKNMQKLETKSYSCSKIIEEKEILITKMQYSPSLLTIPRCTKVTFINQDTTDHWPASDIHPTHGIYPEFDPKKALKPNEKWSFVFEKKGKWSFHDHLYPTTYGTIEVK
jgi:plastocyanin